MVREIGALILIAALIGLPLAALAIQRYLAIYVQVCDGRLGDAGCVAGRGGALAAAVATPGWRCDAAGRRAAA